MLSITPTNGIDVTHCCGLARSSASVEAARWHAVSHHCQTRSEKLLRPSTDIVRRGRNLGSHGKPRAGSVTEVATFALTSSFNSGQQGRHCNPSHLHACPDVTGVEAPISGANVRQHASSRI